jgi:hypothetical protein
MTCHFLTVKRLMLFIHDDDLKHVRILMKIWKLVKNRANLASG